jgi:hypothetical protein
VVTIADKSDFNKDFDNYISSRKNANQFNFFKKVESLIPKKSIFSKKKKNDFEDDYVEEKPKKTFFSNLFKKKKNIKKNYDDEDSMEKIPPKKIKKEVEQLEQEVEDFTEAQDELEQRREGLFKKMFRVIFGVNEKFEEEDIDPSLIKTEVKKEEDILKQETRATLKIVHKWISRLSPEQIDAFRRSPDFVKYKELLERYDLLKKE